MITAHSSIGQKFSTTAVTLVGLATSVGGLLWLSTTRLDTELWIPVASLSLFGLGFGLPLVLLAVLARARQDLEKTPKPGHALESSLRQACPQVTD